MENIKEYTHYLNKLEYIRIADYNDDTTYIGHNDFCELVNIPNDYLNFSILKIIRNIEEPNTEFFILFESPCCKGNWDNFTIKIDDNLILTDLDKNYNLGITYINNGIEYFGKLPIIFFNLNILNIIFDKFGIIYDPDLFDGFYIRNYGNHILIRKDITDDYINFPNYFNYKLLDLPCYNTYLGFIKERPNIHNIHYPKEPPKGFKTNNPYFTINNGNELSARGTLVKYYFRITDPNKKLTAELLKYASLHYILDTGINNLMDEFFNSIVDWEKAAKWISDNSTVISVPVITTGGFWGKPIFSIRKKYYNK